MSTPLSREDLRKAALGGHRWAYQEFIKRFGEAPTADFDPVPDSTEYQRRVRKYSEDQPRDADGRFASGGGGSSSGGGSHSDWVAGGMKGDSPATSAMKDSYSAFKEMDTAEKEQYGGATYGKDVDGSFKDAVTMAEEGDEAARNGDHDTAADFYDGAMDSQQEGIDSINRDSWRNMGTATTKAEAALQDASDYHRVAAQA